LWFKASQAKSSQDPVSKIPNTKKTGWWRSLRCRSSVQALVPEGKKEKEGREGGKKEGRGCKPTWLMEVQLSLEADLTAFGSQHSCSPAVIFHKLLSPSINSLFLAVKQA
jgi:hypothetical protein